MIKAIPCVKKQQSTLAFSASLNFPNAALLYCAKLMNRGFGGASFFCLLLLTHGTICLSRLPSAFCMWTATIVILAGLVLANNLVWQVWECAVRREAAGLHPLCDALEGETAALGWRAHSWAVSASSSKHTIQSTSFNIWSVEADKGNWNYYNHVY